MKQVSDPRLHIGPMDGVLFRVEDGKLVFA